MIFVIKNTYKFLQTYETNGLMIYGGPIMVDPICRWDPGI